MADMNLVMVKGRAVRDPELKYASNGIPVCRFTLATTRRFSKPDGSKGESTVFVDVSAWRRLAELSAQFLKKGREVFVVGVLQPSRKQGDTGDKRPAIRVRADSVQFLSAPAESRPEASV